MLFPEDRVRTEASQVVLVVKNLPANTGDEGDVGSICRSGRSPGGGHGNPLQYSCLENPHGQRCLVGTVHRVTESDMMEASEHAGMQCQN